MNTHSSFERKLIPADQTIVALDTLVLLELCRESPSWLDAFERMSTSGYVFCFADIAIPEVLNALTRPSSLTREALAVGVKAANRFIFPRLPFLPGPHELNVMTGAVVEMSDDALPEVQDHLVAVWDLFGAPMMDAIQYSSGGQRFSLSMANSTAADFVSAERDSWRRHFEDIEAFLHEVDPKENMLNSMRMKVDHGAACTPPISARLDLMLKYLLRRYQEYGRPRSGYNPASRNNDGIDFHLFFVTLAPALLVTRDRAVVNVARSLDSYQRGWILRPEELVNSWSIGRCPRPDWEGPV